ncbi:hypothetical protein SERLA73DRAFT_108623 [Serpula lacrymans var. lacrymans S7.3]|uniref:Carbohydrate kinase PfkB domain-containing protein n=1 Tax=Serpula lacrymans var. lacrymans (strain S7.3) TaxID=936435 RepID=F8PZB6_SERL3|nr:hypothetical protein SERLA73DRAFT_108623 [Serpula lacrymans var. lacrymans S7.3]
MARLRRDTLPVPTHQRQLYHSSSAPTLHPSNAHAHRPKPLRILCTGTLFLAHTLTVPSHPAPGSATRAQAVETVRGGSAGKVLGLLAQFGQMGQGDIEPMLVASLGGNDEGKRLRDELEHDGVSTRYCKIWEGKGIPCAWVMKAVDTHTSTVVNHNPLPDISHEDFIAILGPVLAPENYVHSYNSPGPAPALSAPISPTSLPPTPPVARSSFSGLRSHNGMPSPNLHSPAPFDWLHFEGRSVKTTLNNILGLDGLARERKWRAHSVFSVDIGRRARQGVEALIPHADVIFLTQQYAQAHSPNYASTPRAFLLSLSHLAPPHALLIAHWGTEGAALLSMPTREYFQSSGWVEERYAQKIIANGTKAPVGIGRGPGLPDGVESVRSGSDFWADGGRGRTPESSGYNASTGGHNSNFSMSTSSAMAFSDLSSRMRSKSRVGRRIPEDGEYDDDRSSQMTETGPRNQSGDDSAVEDFDEEGAQDAFVAGMIYALSRRLLPGPPYTPSSMSTDGNLDADRDRGRWKLDECLRFATELSGRKARRRGWEGLADEMRRAGWFD